MSFFVYVMLVFKLTETDFYEECSKNLEANAFWIKSAPMKVRILFFSIEAFCYPLNAFMYLIFFFERKIQPRIKSGGER